MCKLNTNNIKIILIKNIKNKNKNKITKVRKSLPCSRADAAAKPGGCGSSGYEYRELRLFRFRVSGGGGLRSPLYRYRGGLQSRDCRKAAPPILGRLIGA
jgi:hypothetical protein